MQHPTCAVQYARTRRPSRSASPSHEPPSPYVAHHTAYYVDCYRRSRRSERRSCCSSPGRATGHSRSTSACIRSPGILLRPKQPLNAALPFTSRHAGVRLTLRTRKRRRLSRHCCVATCRTAVHVPLRAFRRRRSSWRCCWSSRSRAMGTRTGSRASSCCLRMRWSLGAFGSTATLTTPAFA